MPESTSLLLERSRRELLDLSTRNRLLSIPPASRSAKLLHVVDERSEKVFDRLVRDSNSFTFLPSSAASPARTTQGSTTGGNDSNPTSEDDAGRGSDVEDDLEIPLPPIDDLELDPSTGLPKRQSDSRLQTALPAEKLQMRLLGLHRDARTMLEEQGVNILYLALGQLVWFESEKPDVERRAPLVLLPVKLERKSAAANFYLSALEDDIQENLSLSAKLKTDFGINLPDFAEEESLDLASYFDSVHTAIKDRSGWRLLPDAITLGFFSFSKFLMFRDLHPANWPERKSPTEHPLIAGLLKYGFQSPPAPIRDDVHLDELIPADKLDHVVDADSSQTLAIETVRSGASAVIQGPPGTGKSQSISNIIATAVLDGKRVLFVAEKLAALEVVRRRLENAGLGDICLELHSNKSNKRAVVAEIGRTWDLGKPAPAKLESTVSDLETHRGILNRHSALLHSIRTPSELSAFSVLGHLCSLSSGAEAKPITLPGAETWTPTKRTELRRLCVELGDRLKQVEAPSKHPWRGISAGTVLSIDLPVIADSIRLFAKTLEDLANTAGTLATVMNQPPPSTFHEARTISLYGHYIATAPHTDNLSIASKEWNDLKRASELIAIGEAWTRTRRAVTAKIFDSAWTEDFSRARASIRTYGQSIFRIFNGGYRRSIAQLESACADGPPKSYAERLSLLDQLVEAQSNLRALRDADSLGKNLFGTLWLQENSDWSHFAKIKDWVQLQAEAGLDKEFRSLFSKNAKSPAIETAQGPAMESVRKASEASLRAFRTIAIDAPSAFGVASWETAPLGELRTRAEGWIKHINSLIPWNQYVATGRQARAHGLGPIVDLCESAGGAIPSEELHLSFDRGYYSQLLREFMQSTPSIAQFEGSRHEQIIEEFKCLDKDRIELSKHRVLQAHHERMPHATGIGPAGILQGELQRKRGHLPVRQLLRSAAPLIQAIKPVFMMSPLSVAQFLEPGAIEFDLLVIDEASQVQPVDAFGAIARCRQIVVVGDSRQLPPTQFFARMTSDSPDTLDDLVSESEPSVAARDVESVLGLCCARGLPQTMLRWHYRSRHHSLIAISNDSFYDRRLFIVPSPVESNPDLGLRFHHVHNGTFDRGGTATNREEAKLIAQAVITHASTTPQLSLGVGAFSVRQQTAILNELELLRRENPKTESFFEATSHEPFFVKNLENIQGDERDVIFISVGYGKNQEGHMAMSFGPLSSEGGERRLNVLITRAKRRCEVFASITDEDIDLNRAKGAGVKSLKAFLRYARTGMLPESVLADRPTASPFEATVRAQIESLGHKVDTQVGVAGFFIDLAVRHPDKEGQYVLGIECDGTTYHSARSARDRDRLRQAVLEDHGWVLHRIWSTDWFQSLDAQLKKVQDAITSALRHPASRGDMRGSLNLSTAGITKPNIEVSVSREEQNTAECESLFISLAVPYEVADFQVPTDKSPYEISKKALAKTIVKIVSIEGPFHESEVMLRVRDLWGMGRASARVKEAVSIAIQSAVADGVCEMEDGFLSIPGAPVRIRARGDDCPPNMRKAELLPPAELRAAILGVLQISIAAGEDELASTVARVMGFRSCGGNLREAIQSQIQSLATTRTIVSSEGVWSMTDRNAAWVGPTRT